MNNNNKRIIADLIKISLGIVLFVCGVAKLLDSYWTGMGTALVLIGLLQLIRRIRYQTNETYRENVDVQIHDERNKYLSMKSWSFAGYGFVLIAAVVSIALKIAGFDALVPIASGSVCLILILYWVSFLYLRKKY